MSVAKYLLFGILGVIWVAFMALFFLSDRAERDRLWGFIDETGQIVVPLVYDDVRPYSNGYAAIRRDDRWGFIDRDGTEVIEPRFTQVGDFSARGIAWADDAGRVGYVRPDGKWEIEPRFHIATRFDGDRALAGLIVGHSVTRISGSRRVPIYSFGIINETGEWTHTPAESEDDPERWGSANSFSEGLAAVQLPGNVWGYVDRTGAYAIAPQYARADRFEDGIALVKMQDETHAVIDTRGETLFPIPVKMVFRSEDSYFRAYGTVNGEEGAFFIDRSGGIIAGPFAEATNLVSGRFAVERDKRWYLEDLAGNSYGTARDRIEVPSGGYAEYREHRGSLLSDRSVSGFLNLDGDIAVAARFNRALPFSEGRAAVAERE